MALFHSQTRRHVINLCLLWLLVVLGDDRGGRRPGYGDGGGGGGARGLIEPGRIIKLVNSMTGFVMNCANKGSYHCCKISPNRNLYPPILYLY